MMSGADLYFWLDNIEQVTVQILEGLVQDPNSRVLEVEFHSANLVSMIHLHYKLEQSSCCLLSRGILSGLAPWNKVIDCPVVDN